VLHFYVHTTQTFEPIQMWTTFIYKVLSHLHEKGTAEILAQSIFATYVHDIDIGGIILCKNYIFVSPLIEFTNQQLFAM
jgi:hypothetical protein